MERQWEGTTYGNGWMHRTLIHMLRHLDVRILYVFAAVFVVPPCLVFRDGYKPIYHYFRQRFGYSPIRAFFKTYTNHRIFSETVIDKFAMYAGKRFEIKIEGYEHFLELEKGEKGFVQFSSHIGNYEIAGYTLVSERKKMNALVFANEKTSVMENRSRMFDGTNIHMIPMKADMGHLLAIKEAMDNNEIISLPADRIVGSPRTIELNFLGATASFPLGPFTVATMQQSDVIAVNVMKTAKLKYSIFVRKLEYDKNVSRKEQVRQLAEDYVKELERILRVYPTEWFNYYDFWS